MCHNPVEVSANSHASCIFASWRTPYHTQDIPSLLIFLILVQVSEARGFPPLRSERRLEIQGRPQFGYPCLQAQLNVSISYHYLCLKRGLRNLESLLSKLEYQNDISLTDDTPLRNFSDKAFHSVFSAAVHIFNIFLRYNS